MNEFLAFQNSNKHLYALQDDWEKSADIEKWGLKRRQEKEKCYSMCLSIYSVWG